MKNWIVILVICCGLTSVYAQEKIDPNEEVKTTLMIPSPVEMVVWGKALDVETQIAVGIDVFIYRYTREKKEQGAVYLGRTMAIVLLGLEHMDDRTLGRFLLKIKDGMNSLELDPKYIDEFEGLRTQFENKAISRSDLITQLDIAYADLTSGGHDNKDDNLVYNILQGSAWVQGQNLLARAIKKQNKYEFSKILLDRPAVVDFILTTLKKAKQEGKPESVIDPLYSSMDEYRKATSGANIGPKEIDVVITETDKFLMKY
ncbi:MAG: hypothetical protein HQM12_00840 [SAR324 cluster bacterium]|nr:hypothetical protein [SAR324 cluster bacterium]MBF0352425.1 hypothetical protein [SAR324 cluster bacterium]